VIPKINGLGRSFAGVAAYCLHDAPEPDDRRPRTSERVGWADTRNLATFRPERAARLMAATARAAPDLKRLAGGSPGGRKLAKPVLHYSLSWARDETPDKGEMNRAVDESLEALGLEGHEALIVAHEDTRHPHVHVIANRVDPETGKAGGPAGGSPRRGAAAPLGARPARGDAARASAAGEEAAPRGSSRHGGMAAWRGGRLGDGRGRARAQPLAP